LRILRRPLGWGAGLGGDARARRAVLIASGIAAVLLVVLMLLSGVGPLGS